MTARMLCVNQEESIKNTMKKISEIKLPAELKNQKHVYQMYTIQLKNKKIRDNLQNYLTKNGIMTKVYFHPIHLKSYYKHRFGYKKGKLPRTERLSEKVLTLPIYAKMPKKEIDYVTSSIKDYFKEG